MAMSKAVEAALKTISYVQPEVKNTYKLQRILGKMGGMLRLDTRLSSVDTVVELGDYSIPVRVFFPGKIDEPKGLIVFFHGGGWVTGDIESYNGVCASTAKNTGHLVASVDYRLAPEFKFPIGLNDCYEAAKFFFINSFELYAIDPENITLMGDSAGGNLSAAVSLMARDRGDFLPKRQILLYPATYNDHRPSSPFPSVVENGTDYVLTSQRIVEYMELYESSPEDLENPYFAPLLADNFSLQPDTLVVTAELDPLRDEGEAYGRKLREAGAKVRIYRMMGALHGFYSMHPLTPVVRKSYEMINSFLNGADEV